MRLRIRVLLHALRKPFVPPFFPHDLVRKPQWHFSGSCEKKGGGAPTGAPLVPPRRRKKSLPAYAARAMFAPVPHWRGTKEAARSPFGAPPRSCAEGLTPRLGSGPRFLESPDPNGRTLSGTSAASTWQSGHAPDGRCPEPPGSTVYGRASGNRSRSTFESTLAKGPSVNEMGSDVIDTVTNVKGLSLYTRHSVGWVERSDTHHLSPKGRALSVASPAQSSG